MHRAWCQVCFGSYLYLQMLESVCAHGGQSSIQQRFGPHLQPAGQHRTKSQCRTAAVLPDNTQGGCATQADIRSRSPCLPAAGRCLTCPLEGQAAAPLPGTEQQVSLPAGPPCSMSHSVLSCDIPGECTAAARRAHANRTHHCLWPQTSAPSLPASAHPAPAYSM